MSAPHRPVLMALSALALMSGAGGPGALTASAAHTASRHAKRPPRARCKTIRKGHKKLKRCAAAKRPAVKAPARTSPAGQSPAAQAPAGQSPGAVAPAAPPSPSERFHAMFDRSGWDRPWTADTPQHEPMEDLYDFCPNGAYYERFTNGMTGNDWIYQGSWQLQSVATGTVSGYDVVEGLILTTDQQAKQSQLYVDLSEQLPSTAYINKSEYTRIAPQAC